MGSFDIKSSTTHHTSIRLKTPNTDDFFSQLSLIATQAPKLFYRANIVLDLSLMHDHHLCVDVIHAIRKGISEVGASLIGASNPSSAHKKLCMQLHLPIIYDHKKQIPSNANKPPMLHIDKIRSGMELYAQGDLVVFSNVANGASVLSDKNIFIMGKLQGRASFGLTRDTTCILVTESFNPELLITPDHTLSNANIPSEIKNLPVHIIYCPATKILIARVKQNNHRFSDHHLHHLQEAQNHCQ